MAEVIAADLRAQILNGDLRPGDSLFTESTLMETYEVSRPTLREALRLLEAQSLVTVRRGSHRGPVVSLPGISVAAQSVAAQLQLRKATLGDVYQFRAFFEPQVVRLVAELAEPADLDRLKRIVDDLSEQRGGSPSSFAAIAWTFHHALIEISGNATANVVAATLQRIGEEHSASYLEEISAPEVQQRRAVRAFNRLIVLLEKRDAEAAEAFWATHMEAVYEAMSIENSRTLISGVFD